MFGRRDGLTRELLDVVAQACEKRWNVNRTEDERLFWKQSSEYVFIVTRYQLDEYNQIDHLLLLRSDDICVCVCDQPHRLEVFFFG